MDGIAAYVCNCSAGWSGAECQTDIDECVSVPCANGGQCIESNSSAMGTVSVAVGSFMCNCSSGWSGSTCTVDVDECASLPCANGGTCSDGVDNFTCTCAVGFSMSMCQQDVDECASMPCGNGGICSESSNSSIGLVVAAGAYVCNCSVGWEGANCAVDSL